MGVERQIPRDLWALYETGKNVTPKTTTCALIERIADLAAEVEALKRLLKGYRNSDRDHHYACRTDFDCGGDWRCDLCKRTDQQLQPKGEQG